MATAPHSLLIDDGKKSAHWRARNEAKTLEEALAILNEEEPRDMSIHGDAIHKNLKRKYEMRFPVYEPIFELKGFVNVPEKILKWINNWKKSRTPCLFITGKTKLGKTAYARSIVQPHIYWKGMVNLDEYNPDAKLLIFDDIDWRYMPSPKSWLTQPGVSVFTEKGRSKRTLNIDKPAIFISNELPLWTEIEQTYWLNNAQFVNISNKLY